MRLDMMRGRMIILSILISTSPGNEMSMIVSSLRSCGRRTKPMAVPTKTPLTVNTSSRLFRIQRKTPITTRLTCAKKPIMRRRNVSETGLRLKIETPKESRGPHTVGNFDGERVGTAFALLNFLIPHYGLHC